MFGYDFNSFLREMIYLIPAVAIALSFHEFAHAFVSYKLGDYTQKERGRLTLNPLKHLDPIGTLCLLFFQFGWAKPVEVDPYYYRNKKEGMIWTALAGPLMNMLIGFICVFLCYLMIRFNFYSNYSGAVADYLFQLSYMTALINIGLGIFNLIPLPPLDGCKILMGVLSEETYFNLMRYEMYLSFALILVLVSGVLDGPLFYARSAIVNCFSTISRVLLGMG